MVKKTGNNGNNWQNPTILVAMGLGATDGHLIDTANALAAKFDAHIHLIHCVEPSPAAAWIETYYAPEVQLDMVRVTETKAALAAVADKIKARKVTSNVVVSDAGYGVSAEATSTNAQLVVCGAKNISHKNLLPGLSSALSILAASPVPVMAVRDGMDVSRFSRDWTLLVADDLRDESARVLSFAVNLACRSKASKLKQITIDPPLPFEQVKMGLHRFFGTHWPDEAVQTPFKETHEERRPTLENAMGGRMTPFESTLKQCGCDFSATLASGEVEDKIADEVKALKPTMLIVGHHTKLHKRPFGIGKLTLGALLSFDAPVVIVS